MIRSAIEAIVLLAAISFIVFMLTPPMILGNRK